MMDRRQNLATLGAIAGNPHLQAAVDEAADSADLGAGV